MKIDKFIGKEIHGYLNYEINFDKQITFLIGINGTGKTSVLKLILGLISPSFDYLNSMQYKLAELHCTDQEYGEIIIQSNYIDENTYDLKLSINGEEGEPGLIKKMSQLLVNDSRNEEIGDRLRLIIESFEEQDVVKKIKELTTPLFLGLDRQVYEGQQIDKMRKNFLFRRKYRHFPKDTPLNKSLIDVQEVINDYIRIIASRQPQINQEFKNKILLQSFEFTKNHELKLGQSQEELKTKREQAIEAFENLNIQGFTKQINSFFDQLSAVLEQLLSLKDGDDNKLDSNDIEIYQKWFNNQPQLKRINELIGYNEQYQKEIQSLYLPIEKTEKIINKFFVESGKKFKIEPQGEISIEFEGRGYDSKVYNLSSGEKQIITMLVHLIFFAERYRNQEGIFIIDEPEVSLHLAWQEIFTESILEASPNTQFILATHSPAIIGSSSNDLCQDLASLNLK